MTPAPAPPSLEALAGFLHEALGAAVFPLEERGGVFRPGDGRPVARLGVALEAWPALGRWAAHERLDALFLHRPWRLAPGAFAGGVGVLWSHLPFDERLTTGLNPRLATALDMRAVEPLGVRDGRPLGMIGGVVPAGAGAWAARVAGAFGGHEAALVPDETALVACVAVVGAMTDALVREAATRGAGLYVTGQLRQPARRAVAETGIAVLAVGHARSEWWGARALAQLLVERWPSIALVLAPERDTQPPRAP